MNHRLLLFTCVAGLLLAGVVLTTAAPAPRWTAEAVIKFDGTSTLHDFTGTVEALPFDVRVQWDGPLATVSGTATVAVASMDTKHKKRDRNMRKMFHADSFPLLTGVLYPVQIDPNALPSVPLELRVQGTARTVPLTLTVWEVKEDLIQFEGTLSLSLNQLRLKPPIILGFIRVGDTVAVRISGTIKMEEKKSAVP